MHESREKGRVLLIDDSVRNLGLLTEILENKNYPVFQSTSGAGGLRIARKVQPDLILLDIRMPGMDGFEVCRRLKADGLTRDIPIIFISALGETSEKVKAFQAGGVDFISKPFQAEEVLVRAQTHIELHRMRVDLEEMVTERTAKLQAAREHFQNLFELASDSFYICDREGRIIDVNRQSCKSLGYAREEVLGLRVTAVESVLSQERIADLYERAEKGRSAVAEGLHRRKDGSTFPVEVSLGLFQEREPKLFLAIVRDISDRKQAEKELHHLRNYLSNIIDSMPSVLIGVDAGHHVTLWNQTAEQATGIEARDAQGKRVFDLFPHMAARMSKISESIRTREIRQERRIPRLSENGTFYDDMTIYPLIANGVEGAVIRIDDVTEQVRIQGMMIQSEKMLTVGGLAAGMAHEINNPLAGILMNTQNIVTRLSPELKKNIRVARESDVDLGKIREYMEKREIPGFIQRIRDCGERAANIVANMLEFSRRSESTKSHVDLSRLMDKAVALASSDYNLKKNYDFRKVDIVRDFAPALPKVPCVPMEIEQVVLNLLLNATQAMGDRINGPSRIILRLRQENGMVRMEVEDNGPGMDEATRQRIFEPFFTTKKIESGTGLGLSVSYFIVTNNHGGTLSVESRPGKGAKFIIRLPL